MKIKTGSKQINFAGRAQPGLGIDSHLVKTPLPQPFTDFICKVKTDATKTNF